MSTEAQKILILLAFAVVCAGLNIKSSSFLLNALTMTGLVASLALAAYLMFGWVL